MKAAKIFEGCTYGPETLQVVGTAFDDAWTEIAPHFNDEEARRADVRERLAHAILVLAREDSRDLVKLKDEALQLMAMAYGGSWIDPLSKIST